jgi:hypothetical protein
MNRGCWGLPSNRSLSLLNISKIHGFRVLVNNSPPPVSSGFSGRGEQFNHCTIPNFRDFFTPIVFKKFKVQGSKFKVKCPIPGPRSLNNSPGLFPRFGAKAIIVVKN